MKVKIEKVDTRYRVETEFFVQELDPTEDKPFVSLQQALDWLLTNYTPALSEKEYTISVVAGDVYKTTVEFRDFDIEYVENGSVVSIWAIEGTLGEVSARNLLGPVPVEQTDNTVYFESLLPEVDLLVDETDVLKLNLAQ